MERVEKCWKRGELVQVPAFIGKVINEVDGGARISIDGMKPAWRVLIPDEMIISPPVCWCSK